MSAEEILIVDDQMEVLDHLEKLLRAKGWKTRPCTSGEEALREFEKHCGTTALVLLDIDFGPGRMDGLKVLGRMKAIAPDVPVVVLTGKGTTETAVEALRLGAADFLEKGLYIEDQLDHTVKRTRDLIAVVEENRRLRQDTGFYRSLLQLKYQMVGRSEAFRRLRESIQKVASVPRPVLLIGERGTGKELVAAAIHYGGDRAARPFVTINCAAFHGNLLESEMFGHEKGAFTGAETQKVGRFEMAHQGTLFLDEVANMPMEFQEKILRVVEYQQFERLGGTEATEVDVRLIAATNADLRERIEAGEFRADLYDRLAFATIVVPPLRERKDDLEPLVEHFSRRFREEVAGLAEKGFADEAMAAMMSYSWPGNVRELKNVVEWALCSAPGSAIQARDLPPEIVEADEPDATFHDKVARYERSLIQRALTDCGNNQKAAAKCLGLSYDQFRHYYRKYKDALSS